MSNYRYSGLLLYYTNVIHQKSHYEWWLFVVVFVVQFKKYMPVQRRHQAYIQVIEDHLRTCHPKCIANQDI